MKIDPEISIVAQACFRAKKRDQVTRWAKQTGLL